MAEKTYNVDIAVVLTQGCFVFQKDIFGCHARKLLLASSGLEVRNTAELTSKYRTALTTKLSGQKQKD